MAGGGVRDNDYWLQRMKKDGHAGLLERITAGEITVYRATQIAGYRAKGPRTPAGKLSYHWKRASAAERMRFAAAHALEIDRVLKELGRELKALKAKNSGDADEK